MSPSYVICGFKLFFYRPLMSAELCSARPCVEKVGHSFFFSMFYTLGNRRQIFSICKSSARARATLLLKRSRDYLTRPDVKRMRYSIGRCLIHHVCCGCIYVCVCTPANITCVCIEKTAVTQRSIKLGQHGISSRIVLNNIICHFNRSIRMHRTLALRNLRARQKIYDNL